MCIQNEYWYVCVEQCLRTFWDFFSGNFSLFGCVMFLPSNTNYHLYMIFYYYVILLYRPTDSHVIYERMTENYATKKTRKVNLFRCGSEIAEAIYVLGRHSLSYFRVCTAAQLKQVSRWLYLNYKMWLLLMFSSHANFRECVFFCTRRTLSIEITFLLFWLAIHKRFSTVFSLSNSHTNCELKRLHYNHFFCFQLYFLCFSSDCEGNLVFFSTPLCNV